VRIDDREIAKDIETKLVELISCMDASGWSSGQVWLQISERRQRKGWFLKSDEEIPWERWSLTLNILAERNKKGKSVAESGASPMHNEMRSHSFLFKIVANGQATVKAKCSTRYGK
jgi:hypothetical protein